MWADPQSRADVGQGWGSKVTFLMQKEHEPWFPGNPSFHLELAQPTTAYPGRTHASCCYAVCPCAHLDPDSAVTSALPPQYTQQTLPYTHLTTLDPAAM